LFTAYNLEDGMADTREFDFSSDMSRADGIAFNADGTEMFLTSNNIDAVARYSFATGFDISSSSTYDGSLIDLSEVEDVSTDMHISSNGRFLYVIGIRNDKILSYDIAGLKFKESELNDGALDGEVEISIEGETFAKSGNVLVNGVDYSIDGLPDGIDPILSVTSDGSAALLTLDGNALDNESINDVRGLTFNFENTAFTTYIAADVTGAIAQDVDAFLAFDDNPSLIYGLGFSMKEGVTSSGAYSVKSEDDGANGLFFSPNGSQMFVAGVIGDAVYEYSLSNSFDISTGVTYLNSPFDVSDEETVISGVSFSPDGRSMHIVGTNGDEINQYSLSVPFDLSTAEPDGSPMDLGDLSFPEDLAFGNSGNDLYVVAANPRDEIQQYALSSPYDIGSASFVRSFDLSSFDGGPTGLAFDVTGKKLFVVGVINDRVFEFDLSTAWDISTADLAETLDIAEEGSLEAIQFNEDGSRMFLIGNSSDSVRQYDLVKPDFTEIDLNNGSLSGTMTFILKLDTFNNAGGTLEHDIDYTVDNLPTGLVPVLEVSSDGLTAELTLEGRATDNQDIDDVEELLFTFSNSAFVSDNASAVKNASMSGGGVGIDFTENLTATWIGGASGAKADWATASNWSGATLPAVGTNVIIPNTDNQPKIMSGTLAEINDLEVQSGATLLLESGASLAIYGGATVDGVYQVTRNVTGSAGYSIVSSPVEDFNLDDLSADYLFGFDGSNYVVSSGNMDVGKGYFVGYDAASPSITFEGSPNTSSVTSTVNEGDFALVGNPYAAPVSISEFLTENASTIAGTVYFWDDGGTNVGENRGGDFVTANAIGAVSAVQPDGVDDGVAGLQGTSAADNGVIPSAQGVFVEGIATGSISFTPIMQESGSGLNDDANYYRKAGDLPKIRLSVSGENFYDETLIGFMADATLGRDMQYDAKKLSDHGLSAMIDDDRFAIQGLPIVEDEMMIPLLLDASAGNFEFTVSIEGFNDSYELSLKNLSNDSLFQLQNDHITPFTTSVDQTKLALVIKNKDVPDSSIEVFKIVPTLHQTTISGVTSEQELVRIYGFDGRILYSEIPSFRGWTSKHRSGSKP
ncbi:MAG: hypothetical protein AAFO69_09035, partial [Bacteroidota bacterium]